MASFKAINNKCVNSTPRPIVNCGNFITIEKKVLGLLHNSFGTLMPCMFLSIYQPMELMELNCLLNVFFTFKISKNYFMLLKFANDWPSFKSQNMATN